MQRAQGRSDVSWTFFDIFKYGKDKWISGSARLRCLSNFKIHSLVTMNPVEQVNNHNEVIWKERRGLQITHDHYPALFCEKVVCPMQDVHAMDLSTQYDVCKIFSYWTLQMALVRRN